MSVQKFLVTFDIHGCQPGSGIYYEVYKDLKEGCGQTGFCKDFGLFCIVRTNENVAEIQNFTRDRIRSKANGYLYKSADVVVFSVGDKIAITRGEDKGGLRDFKDFLRNFD